MWKSRKILTGPYLLWSIAFTILPLLMIVYYGMTTEKGRFTWSNLAQITTPEDLKALGLALLLSFVSTAICLILAYPLAMILSETNVNQTSFYCSDLYSSDVDEFPASNTCMAESAGKKWGHQHHSDLFPPSGSFSDQHTGCHHSGNGL